jgi:hypothetical protein
VVGARLVIGSLLLRMLNNGLKLNNFLNLAGPSRQDRVRVLRPGWEQDRVTEKILPIVRNQLRTAQGRNPNRSPGSSTPEASRAPPRPEARPVATTPGKTSPRPQAVHRHRHPRPAPHRHGLHRRTPGPRRREDNSARHLPHDRSPVHPRRRRIRRTSARPGADLPAHHHRGRAQTRRSTRVWPSPGSTDSDLESAVAD